MATYRKIIQGLEILATLEPRGQDDYGVDAEHDQIYAGPEAELVPEEMQKKLEDLGWFISDGDRFSIYT